MPLQTLVMLIWYAFITPIPNNNSLVENSLLFCKVVNRQPFWTDIEPVLNQIEDAIASDSVPSLQLLNLCFKILAGASMVLPEELKTILSRDDHFWCTVTLLFYRLESEKIVRQLKQLPSRIQNGEQGFLRDAFRVTSRERNAEYLVQATEYYSPVQFYENFNGMMKLIEWKVYKLPSSLLNLTNADVEKLTFVAQYNLERSQFKDGTPIHVFGRTDIEDGGHVSIVNYGAKPGPEIDGYYQMKLLVIKDLKSLNGLPVLARTIRNWEVGVDALIMYGYKRRYGESLGIEINNDMFYDDDMVTKYDAKTKQRIENSEL